MQRKYKKEKVDRITSASQTLPLKFFIIFLKQLECGKKKIGIIKDVVVKISISCKNIKKTGK